MLKILLICVVFIVGWYGNTLYTSNALPFLPDLLQSKSQSTSSVSSVSIDDKIKCTTKEGRVLYGKLPEGVVCAKHETVKASIIILPSKVDTPTNPDTKDNKVISH
jgi:hypothetical protein